MKCQDLPKVCGEAEKLLSMVASSSVAESDDDPIRQDCSALAERIREVLRESRLERVRVAATAILSNLIDAREYGPESVEHGHEEFPRDEDGDPWYPDIWELREALASLG